MRKKQTLSALLALALSSGLAMAHGFKVAAISIGHPFAYATPPLATNGATYLKLTNDGSSEDVLVAASSALADKIEIRETAQVGGVVKMLPRLEGVAIPAHGRVEFAEGSFHLMLVGLKHPLNEGERVPLRLTFRDAGDIAVEASIIARKAPAADLHAGH